MEVELLETSDPNLVAFLSANGVPFKTKEPSVLSGLDNKIEVHFQIQKSPDTQKLIEDYIADRCVGVQTFLRSSKFVKDSMMQIVRNARRNQLRVHAAIR
jgi:hypothetical protein